VYLFSFAVLADKFSLEESVSSPVESHHCFGSVDSLLHHPNWKWSRDKT